METQVVAISIGRWCIIFPELLSFSHRYGTSRCYDMSHSSVGATGGSQTVPCPQEEAICRCIGVGVVCDCVLCELSSSTSGSV